MYVYIHMLHAHVHVCMYVYISHYPHALRLLLYLHHLTCFFNIPNHIYFLSSFSCQLYPHYHSAVLTFFFLHVSHFLLLCSYLFLLMPQHMPSTLQYYLIFNSCCLLPFPSPIHCPILYCTLCSSTHTAASCLSTHFYSSCLLFSNVTCSSSTTRNPALFWPLLSSRST